MTNTTESATDPRADDVEDAKVRDIVGRGPGGAFAVAGIATVIVLALYFGFYVFAYLPRGVVQ